MRVLRLLRPARSAAALEAGGPADNLGLDAFATEAPPPSAPSLTARADPRLRLAIVALAVVVVLESVPAFLWVQNWMKPVEPALTRRRPSPFLCQPPLNQLRRHARRRRRRPLPPQWLPDPVTRMPRLPPVPSRAG